jgi:predicted dehydrogenase
VAAIGTGHGHAFSKIRALRNMPEYDFAGVCRPDASEPEEGEPLRGVRRLSLKDILDDASIGLVAIESADVERNLQYAGQCVEARKFVHLDKPPGADLERLRKLLADAAEHKLIVQMGYQWRYHPAMQAAIEAARKGWLGQVYRFRASIDKLILADERRHLAKFRGGMMFSEGCGRSCRRIAGKAQESQADRLADNNLAILEYDHALAEISMAGFHSHGARYKRLGPGGAVHLSVTAHSGSGQGGG